jgi:CHAT domain-containing protein/tetratricopeptide (TPR) repeat protein
MKILPKIFVLLLSAGAVVLALSAVPAFGQEALKEANELNQRVVKLYQAGKYAEALSLAHSALEFSEKALGSNHTEVGNALNNLAELYRSTGEYQGAKPLFQRALAIQEKALGPDHPDVANALNNLGLLYKTTGEYSKAEPLLQRSLGIQERAFGSNHPNLTKPLTNLASLYFTIGDYQKAELLMQRSLTIGEKAVGPDHPDVAIFLINFGRLYTTIGDYPKAEKMYQRGLAIQEKSLGPNHPNVAQAINNLAGLYRMMGEDTKVEPLLRRALEIREKAFGPNHPSVAESLNNLAVVYQPLEDYAKAEPLLLRALGIYEKSFGPDHPSVAQSLNNLGALYVDMGQYAKAAQFMQRALAIREKALGPNHPSADGSLFYMAWLEAAQQHYKTAIGLYKKSFPAQEQQIQNIFTFTSEEQKLQLIQSISGWYSSFLSLIHQHLREDREAVRDGLELVLHRKGVVFDAQSRTREALQGRMSKTARKEWDRLSGLRSDLARLLLNKPEKLSLEDYRTTLASLQQQIEETEKHLAAESILVAKELQQRTISIERATKNLPKDSALVEFVKIRDFDFTKRKLTPSSRYLVFVLTGEGNVTLVDLGEASALEALAQRALTDIKTSLGTRGIEILKVPCDRSVDPRGIEILTAPCGRDAGRQSAQLLQELHAQVWVPLEKALGKADKVVLSPDGLLNLVPFAALVNSQGRSLIEQYQLTYVTSGRELVGTEDTLPRPDSDLLLVANPSFDQKGSDAGRQGTALRSREFRGVFTPLPGTERESREIPPLVVAPKEQKQVLVGERATETAVKATRSPRILHLATHGFFLPDNEVALDAMKFGGLPDRGITLVARPTAKRYENPLVRSGLAFAGANHATGVTDGDDGILTALEITGMDLYGTELVVLSACDTGVGEVKTGEGVFGLRRSFALAGAKNLLMSLWEVSDEVTARQMKAFYQNLQKLPPAQALRQAQLETIKDLKTEYGGLAPPGLWAPFILQGAQALR